MGHQIKTGKSTDKLEKRKSVAMRGESRKFLFTNRNGGLCNKLGCVWLRNNGNYNFIPIGTIKIYKTILEINTDHKN